MKEFKIKRKIKICTAKGKLIETVISFDSIIYSNEEYKTFIDNFPSSLRDFPSQDYPCVCFCQELKKAEKTVVGYDMETNVITITYIINVFDFLVALKDKVRHADGVVKRRKNR